MELDELKIAWNQMDQRLSATMAVQRGLYREIRADRARASLGKFLRLPVFELIVGLIAGLPAGIFLIQNFDQGTFAGSLSPLAVFLLGVVTVVLSVLQIQLIASLDYSGPVVDIQRKLAQITRVRIKSAAWLMALLTPLWLVFPTFVIQLLAGREGYRAFSEKLAEFYSTPWFAINFFAGVILVVAACLAIKWKGSAINWSKVLSEQSLQEAAAHLTEIEEFENEG
jgi:hypothetical protein